MKDTRKQVNFRLSDEEAAKVELKAQAANLSVSGYCRIMAVEGKVKPQIMDKETGKALLPHLSHIGSNINQLAKVANSEGITLAMAAQLETVQNQFNALWELLLEGRKPKKEEVIIPVEVQEQKKEEKQDEAHTCPMCGGVAVRRHSDKHDQDYWICPNYSKEEKGHLFKWVE